jgi:hypothetical protein
LLATDERRLTRIRILGVKGETGKRRKGRCTKERRKRVGTRITRIERMKPEIVNCKPRIREEFTTKSPSHKEKEEKEAILTADARGWTQIKKKKRRKEIFEHELRELRMGAR